MIAGVGAFLMKSPLQVKVLGELAVLRDSQEDARFVGLSSRCEPAPACQSKGSEINDELLKTLYLGHDL